MLVPSAGVNACIGNLLPKENRLVLLDGAGHSEQFFSLWLIGGMSFTSFHLVLFATSIDGAPGSSACAVLATTGFALLAVSSNTASGERLTPTQGAGVVAAAVGIALLARDT